MLFKSTSTMAFTPARASSPSFLIGKDLLKGVASCPSFKLGVLMDPNQGFDTSIEHSLSMTSTTASSDVSSIIDLDFDSKSLEQTVLLEDIVLQNDNEALLSSLRNDRISLPTLKSLASTLEVDISNIINYSDLSTKPIICGHRGAVYESLENTCHSINRAHQLGCDEVEIDVFLLKCGTLCVFHGSGTDARPGLFEHYSTNMDGSILDYTYQEIKDKFKFNPYYEEFGCGSEIIRLLENEHECYIPTLEEILIEAKKCGVTVKIELKGPNTPEPTLELVESLNMVNQVHYSSFDLSRINRIRELRPQRCPHSGQHIYKTGALFDKVPDNFIQIALGVGATEIHLKYSHCTKSRVNDIHEAGMDSMCWFRGPIGMKYDVTSEYYDVGNEDEMMFRIVMATGVKKMCVNKPNVLIQMLNQQ